MKEKGGDKSGHEDIRNEEGASITDPTEVRKIKEHYEPFITIRWTTWTQQTSLRKNILNLK